MLDTANDIAEAMSHLHESGIVHAALKVRPGVCVGGCKMGLEGAGKEGRKECGIATWPPCAKLGAGLAFYVVYLHVSSSDGLHVCLFPPRPHFPQ